MSKLNTYFVSQVFAFSYFWIAISVPFLSSRGLSAVEIFGLMSLYQVFGIVLEYPTGVLGDKFGYKQMLSIGNYLSGISMIVMVIANNYNGYLLGMFILALASGFLSGNDMGMLKLVSNSIKKDTANYHALSDLGLFAAAIIGGWIANHYGYNLALLISGALMTFANVPLKLIRTNKTTQNRSNHSFISILKDGIKSLRHPIIAQLFLVIAIFGGFTFTIKSVIGSFGDIYGLNVMTISLYVGISGLARAIGGKLNAHFPTQKSWLPLTITGILTFFVSIMSGANAVLNSILVLQVAIGYISSLIDGDLQELVSDHIRSSIFSIKRLTMRFFSSIFLAMYGFAVDHQSYNIMLFGVALMMLVSVVISKKYTSANLSQK